MANDSSGSRVVLSEAVPLQLPLCLYIDVSNICNFKCPWCPTGLRLQKKVSANSGVMSMDVFKKIVYDLKSWTGRENKKVKTIALFMLGEPLINKNFFEMSRMIKEADICERMIVSTNGSLLDSDEKATELLECGFDLISFSMYGASDKEYLEVSSKFSFNTILNNARRLKRIRDQRSRNPVKIFFKYFENTDKIASKKDELLQCCDHIAFEEANNWDSTYSRYSGRIISPRNMRDVKYCPQPWYVMSVVWDGTVVSCCSDWQWKNNIGNATNKTLKEIWHGTTLVNLKKDIAEGKIQELPACKGCNSYKSTARESVLDQLIQTNPQRALKKPR